MDSQWDRFLENPEAIRQIYSTIPSLREIELKEVVFQEDGPTVLIKVSLTDLPTHPPSRWLKQRFNRVQLELQLLSLSSLRCAGWGTSNVGSLEFLNHSDGVQSVFFGGNGCEFDFIHGFLRLNSIQPYLVESV